MVIAALVLLVAEPAGAANAVPPYEDSYIETSQTPDLLPGFDSASATATADKSTGNVLVDTSAFDTFIVGVNSAGYDVLGSRNTPRSGPGASNAQALAFVRKTLPVSGAGTIQAVVDTISGVHSSATCQGCLVSGLQQGASRVVAALYVEYLNASFGAVGNAVDEEVLAQDNSNLGVPSATLSVPVPAGVPWVNVYAGLIAYSDAKGPAQADAGASGTVANMTTP